MAAMKVTTISPERVFEHASWIQVTNHLPHTQETDTVFRLTRAEVHVMFHQTPTVLYELNATEFVFLVWNEMPLRYQRVVIHTYAITPHV